MVSTSIATRTTRSVVHFATDCGGQRSLNALLEESCAKHDGLVYLPPPIWAENEDGSLNRDKSDGIIHVNPTPENKRAAVEAALAVAN
jgi:hypothetical protein